MQHVWIIIGNIALFFAAIVTTALVIVYGVFTKWEKTQVGRQFMLTKACFAIVLDFSFIAVTMNHQLQQYTGFTPVRAFIYGLVGIVMLRWLIILIHAQINHRRSQVRREQ